MPDYEEDAFVPWASNGYDSTTLHRLRIPRQEMAAEIARVTPEGEIGVIFAGDACGRFARYFSRREASMLERIFLFPFMAESELQALLLVTESQYLYEDEYLRVMLAAVAEPTGGAMRSRRISDERILRRALVFRQSELEVAVDRVASQATHVCVVLLELSDIVSQVAEAAEYLDSFRVRQDVLRVLASQFASTASVCDVDANRALLLIHGQVGDDLDLTVHHAAAAIAYLLPEISGVPVMRTVIRSYPDDGTELGSLITSIL